MFGENTAHHLRDRFQLGLTQSAVDAYLERLIVTSIGSNWTRLYDSVSENVESSTACVLTHSGLDQFQYYSQGVL
jgi:hypothetical protein